MNRSSKGFGLVGVVATVLLLIIAAIFSASARSNSLLLNDFFDSDTLPSQVDVLKK